MRYRFSFPFKAGGLFVLAAGSLVLIRGLAYRNPYELVLSGGGLAVWLVLFLAGFFSARRLAGIQPGWLPPVPLTAGSGSEAHTITGLDARVPYFFRLHFIVKGEFLPGNGRKFLASGEAAGGGEPTARLTLEFPLSGIFHARGACRLRDVFGFFSFPCGPVLHRSLPVQPAPYHRKPLLRIDPFSGSEDKQSRSQTDEERYYMREYAPGDRFRDINWKTSERLATLITRISPFTQEKTRLVHVVFRNYGPAAPPFLSLWLLDRTKARLIMFLRTLREEHPDFIFHIYTASDERLVQADEDIEVFVNDLAGMSFMPPAGAPPAPEEGQAAGELYLFSTSCDTGLPFFLAARREAPSYLYITVPAKARGGGKTQAARKPQKDIAVLRARDIIREGLIPVSGFLSRLGSPGPASIPAPGKGNIEINYAELRL